MNYHGTPFGLLDIDYCFDNNEKSLSSCFFHTMRGNKFEIAVLIIVMMKIEILKVKYSTVCTKSCFVFYLLSAIIFLQLHILVLVF